MLCLRGVGKRAMEQELFAVGLSVLEVDVPSVSVPGKVDTVHVRIVRRYKHMGGIHSSNGSLTPEVHNRVGMSAASYNRIKSRR